MARQNVTREPCVTSSRTVCIAIVHIILAMGLTSVFIWTLFHMKREMNDDCFSMRMDIEKLTKEVADLRTAVIKSVEMCSRLKESQAMEIMEEDINYGEEENKELEDGNMDSMIEEPPIEPGHPNPMTNTIVRRGRSLRSLNMANDTSLNITNGSDNKPMPKLKRLALMMMLNDSSDSLITNNSLTSSESAMPSMLPDMKRSRIMKNSKQKDINTSSLDKNFKRTVDYRHITSQLGEGNEYLSRNSFVADHFGSNHATFLPATNKISVNMKVQHSDGRHKHWESKLQLSNVNKYFIMKDGNLTVKQAGLYFVYAQILYSNLHDMNGYQIFHNSESVLECLTTNVAPESKANVGSAANAKNGAELNRQLPKPNTCFTAGLIYCESDDKLSIRTAQPNREIVLNSSQSFFGLLKVGD